MKQEFSKPVRVKIFYDEALKEITGKDFEEVMVLDGLDFANFLNFVFTSYPKITKRFIPGTLAFLLNDKIPKENNVLKNGDVLKIFEMKIEDTRRIIESQLREIIAYYQVDTTFEEIKEIVYNENSQKDFNNLIERFVSKIKSNNLDEINEVLKFVNAVWNFFPHKSLNGLSPVEKLKSIRTQN